MVSLDQYLDSQAAQAAKDVIKIYMVGFAHDVISDPRTPVQQFRDLEKILEVYKKNGVHAVFDEVQKQTKHIDAYKELPMWYYLIHNSKEVTFYLLEKLNIKDYKAFKEKVVKYCKNKGNRPAVLDELDDSLLTSYFNSHLIGYKQKVRFKLATKKAERKIKKLVCKHYSKLLKLVKNSVGELEAEKWECLIIEHRGTIDKEIDVLRKKFLPL